MGLSPLDGVWIVLTQKYLQATTTRDRRHDRRRSHARFPSLARPHRRRRRDRHGLGTGTQGEREIQLLPPFCPGTSFPPEALIAQMNWAGVDKAVLRQVRSTAIKMPWFLMRSRDFRTGSSARRSSILGTTIQERSSAKSSRRASSAALNRECTEPTGLVESILTRGLTIRGLRRSGTSWRPAAWCWLSIWGPWAPGPTRRPQSA